MDKQIMGVDLLREIELTLAGGEIWIAYNAIPYQLEKGDVYCFREQSEAVAFAAVNSSDWDSYRVIEAKCVDDLYKKIGNAETMRWPTLRGEEKKNFEGLKSELELLEFGENLHWEVGVELQKREPHFQIVAEHETGNKAFVAVLNFSRKESSDQYAFNGYHATLQNAEGDRRSQVFPTTNGHGVTMKEAFNMLDGRSVFKGMTDHGRNYKAWVQIDFNRRDGRNNHLITYFPETYGFNLCETLRRLPIAERKGVDSENYLRRSLEKGNLQPVRFESRSGARQMLVAANPHLKKIEVYNSLGKLVSNKAFKSQSVQRKDAIRQVIGAEDNSQKKDTSDESLLPKFRVKQESGERMGRRC